jgi:DNA invertase Pin-like site-specific DNA recombinase
LKFGGTATKAYPHHTPAGKAMFQMMGVFAEFERAMIAERVKSGLSRARSQGKRLGRRPVSTDVVERIREQLNTGAGMSSYLGRGRTRRTTIITDREINRELHPGQRGR